MSDKMKLLNRECRRIKKLGEISQQFPDSKNPSIALIALADQITAINDNEEAFLEVYGLVA